MSSELAKLVSTLLSRGYQLDPGGYDFLCELPGGVDRGLLIERVIQVKRSASVKSIGKEDLQSALPEEFGSLNVLEPIAVSFEPQVEIVSDPTNVIAPLEAGDGFKKLFNDRYWRLLAIVRRRPDVKDVSPAESVRVAAKKDRVRIAGLISSKVGRNGRLEFTLDDPTGMTRIVSKDEAVTKVIMRAPIDSLVLVECVRGEGGRIYANSVVFPDIPNRKPVTGSHKIFAVLLSDLHIGSRMFLEDEFKIFLLWLNGKVGDLEIVNRIKYVVISGDVVDGVGVYPGQEYQLAEKSLVKQHVMASQLLAQIPKHMEILIGPGNHDPVRQALPQPAVPSEFAEPLWKMGNVRLVGNPSYVKLHGVTFLMYHGRSLDDIIATVPDLVYNRPAAAMQVLLKMRHLAPTYGKRTALSPEPRDMLVVDPVPDVFHSGHVHTVDVLNYRGTLIVNSGTWQSQTPFQANMGLEPTPAIVPIVDLSTLEVIKRSFVKSSFNAAGS